MTRRYQPHPLAQIIPPMTPDEYRDLKADIKTNGLEQPITLYEEKILDGIHRERACAELGLEVETREWRKRNGQTPVQYVLSMNGHRRHLSPGQKAALAVELASEMRKLYPASQPGGGERGDPGRIAAALGQKLVPDSGHQVTVLELTCSAVGAGTNAAGQVQTLKTETPKLYTKVRDGLITVADATRERRAAEPKPRKSSDEINAGLIRQLIGQLKSAADTVAKLEARDVELVFERARRAGETVEGLMSAGSVGVTPKLRQTLGKIAKMGEDLKALSENLLTKSGKLLPKVEPADILDPDDDDE